jgi:hypothetical protein
LLFHTTHPGEKQVLVQKANKAKYHPKIRTKKILDLTKNSKFAIHALLKIQNFQNLDSLPEIFLQNF